jgi:hypothetical protein
VKIDVRRRNLTGKFWRLDELGTLAPNQQKEIKRRGQPRGLNHTGDRVELLKAAGGIIQT